MTLLRAGDNGGGVSKIVQIPSRHLWTTPFHKRSTKLLSNRKMTFQLLLLRKFLAKASLSKNKKREKKVTLHWRWISTLNFNLLVLHYNAMHSGKSFKVWLNFSKFNRLLQKKSLKIPVSFNCRKQNRKLVSTMENCLFSEISRKFWSNFGQILAILLLFWHILIISRHIFIHMSKICQKIWKMTVIFEIFDIFRLIPVFR